jgi:hypothetical protein
VAKSKGMESLPPIRTPFCTRRTSGNKAACSDVAASEMMAIKGSTSAKLTNAAYHASSQR